MMFGYLPHQMSVFMATETAIVTFSDGIKDIISHIIEQSRTTNMA